MAEPFQRPKDWCRCSKEGLDYVLAWENWEKDEHGVYRIKGGQPFAVESSDQIWINAEYICEP